jgi:hypothetical protein
VFGRNLESSLIGVALELLKSRGMARCEVRSTKGAPVEVWICV